MDSKAVSWLNGFIGVAIFAGSLPATRVAVLGMDPFFLTGARAVVAALLAAVWLLIGRVARPKRSDLLPLAVVGFGVVLGFPLLTALALQYITSAHSIVYVALLPLCTALFGVVLAGERHKPVFWLCSVLGCLLVMAYAAREGLDAAWQGDLYMLAAVVVCGLGYAEGGRLSRRLGGWQVICWALVLSSPFMFAMMLWFWPQTFSNVNTAAWLGFGYVSVFSMFLGFVFWYRGLAQGGIAAVGQLQLLQPFMGLGLAAALLGESVNASMIWVTLGAALCVAGARRFAS
ncbi:DMT family transporter [Alcaligenes faecalis subsp. phenolicus]|uniref:DMT family transporter n=1 Tax=Alcaligenes nematophilus TaxID=2994643 RepID=UPI002AA2C926|nr:DMT family transporter [Alcaligenes phenolicus]